MLIEDITIETELVGFSFDNNIKVKSMTIGYGVNTLASANINIEISPAGAVQYHSFQDFKLSEIVGKEILIRWKNDQLIFQGRVSGVHLVKTAGNVSYSLMCMGGPLALANTTVAVKGWFPLGSDSNARSATLFANVITGGLATWTSPKTFLEKLISETQINGASKADNALSEASRDHLKTLLSELNIDLDNIREPSVLRTFWGTTGVYNGFRDGIRTRMQTLTNMQASEHTYWNLVLLMVREIGATAVPWFDQTLLLPNMLFGNAPKANVLFPSMIQSIDVNTDPFTFPDQVIVPIDNSLRLDPSIAINLLTPSNCIVFPGKINEFDNLNSPFAGTRYMVVTAPKYAESILKYGGKAMYLKVKQLMEEDESQGSTLEARTDLTKASLSNVNIYKEFAKNLAGYTYQKLRTERNTANVITVFHPFLVPGFPCYTIDGSTKGMSFRGVVQNIQHNIDEYNAQTQISLSYVTPIDEQITIPNPIFEKILPASIGANSEDTSVYDMLDTIIPGFGNQIPFTAALLQEPAMSDAKAAFEFSRNIV